MKKTSLLLLSLVIVLSLAVNVWATPVTFTPDVVGSSVIVTDTAPLGKLTGTLALSGSGFTLADGAMQTLNFFTLNANGISFGRSYNIEATLAFSAPPIGSEGVGGGKFYTFFGVLSGGTLSWNDMPKNYTLADGNVISIDFQDGWDIGLGDTVMVHAYVTNNGGGTAVPEPTTMLLFGLGLLGLAGLRRKFKKK